MTAPDLTTRLAEVQAQHRPQRGKRDHKAHCICGWESTELGETILRHEEHRADMLAEAVQDREAEAWEKGRLAGDVHAYYAGQYPLDPNPYRSTN